MAREAPTTPSPEYMHSAFRSCPQCTGSVYRIQRRLLDRVFSLFAPSQRYRCRNFSCRWEGNLRVERKQANDGESTAAR